MQKLIRGNGHRHGEARKKEVKEVNELLRIANVLQRKTWTMHKVTFREYKEETGQWQKRKWKGKRRRRPELYTCGFERNV